VNELKTQFRQFYGIWPGTDLAYPIVPRTHTGQVILGMSSNSVIIMLVKDTASTSYMQCIEYRHQRLSTTSTYTEYKS